MNVVFGTCVRADPTGANAFFRVEGRFDERGNFARLNQVAARRQFPNRGAIRSKNLSNNGHYGTFTFVEDPNFERYASDPYAAKFKAIPTASSLYQVLQVPETSVDIDIVAQTLSAGVDLLAEVASRTPIFILFSDQVLCGPIYMKAIEGRKDHFILEQQEWTTLKPAYRNFSHNNLLEFFIPQSGNVSFATMPIRNPDTLFDFAPLDYAFRKILEIVRQSEGVSSQLTNAKLKDLALSLSKVTPTRELKPRIEALAARLRTIDTTNVEFAVLLQRCLALPQIQNRIDEEAKSAKVVALEDFRRQQTKAIEALEIQKKDVEINSATVAALSQQKSLLEEDLQNLQTAIQTSKTRFNESVVEAMENAEKDAIGFFSKIAVMRPFLTDNRSLPPATTTPCLPVERITNSAKVITDFATAIRTASDVLKLYGVGSRSAFIASAEIVSALYTGQTVSFRGSLSGFAATIVTRTLSAGSMALVDIPIGTRLQLKLNACAPGQDDPNPLSGVLIMGANRSCLDVYGGDVLERVRFRLTGVLPRSTSPHVYLALLEGPSTLSATPQMAEIGPIIHTDLWNWTPRHDTVKREMTRFQAQYEPEPNPDVGDTMEQIRPCLTEIPSALFLSGVKILFPVLTKAHLQLHPSKDKALEAAMCSLVNSWILPFLFAAKATEEQIATCVELANGDADVQKHYNLLKHSQEC